MDETMMFASAARRSAGYDTAAFGKVYSHAGLDKDPDCFSQDEMTRPLQSLSHTQWGAPNPEDQVRTACTVKARNHVQKVCHIHALQGCYMVAPFAALCYDDSVHCQ
jgi:hypothetical protein